MLSSLLLRDGAILLLAFLLFYAIINAPLSSTLKVFLAIALLYSYGLYAQRRYGLEGGHGLILYKNREVVGFIRRLARSLPLERVVDAFLIASFGVLALPALRGGWASRALTALLGVVILTAVGLLYPFSFIFLSSSLDIEGSSSPAMPLYYLFGIGGSATFSVLSGAISTISELFSPSEAKARATLLLPGINLPLLEGLLALAFVLLAHEFAHGIVALRHGIRLSSAGLLFFGFLPIGGFVEPDERVLSRADKLARLRVYGAGTMANFLFAFLAFALLLAFAHLTTPLAKEGCLVVGGTLEKGTFIYAKGGECVKAEPNDTVVLETDRGEITVKANEEGKIGIYVLRYSKDSLLRYYGNGLDFLYNFLALLFSLNMVVGVVNLLPAFVFDGARMVEELLPSALAKAVNAITFLALLLLFLPALL